MTPQARYSNWMKWTIPILAVLLTLAAEPVLAEGAAPPPLSAQSDFLKSRGVAISTSANFPDWFVNVATPTASDLDKKGSTYAVGLMEVRPSPWQDRVFGCVIHAMAEIQTQVQSQASDFVHYTKEGDASGGPLTPPALLSTTKKLFTKLTWGRPAFQMTALKKSYSSSSVADDYVEASVNVVVKLPDDLVGLPKVGVYRATKLHSWLAWSRSEFGWVPDGGPQLDSQRLARVLDAFRDAGFVLTKMNESEEGLTCSVSLSAKDFRDAVARSNAPTKPSP